MNLLNRRKQLPSNYRLCRPFNFSLTQLRIAETSATWAVWANDHNITLAEDEPDDFSSNPFPSDALLSTVRRDFKYPEYVVDPKVSDVYYLPPVYSSERL